GRGELRVARGDRLEVEQVEDVHRDLQVRVLAEPDAEAQVRIDRVRPREPSSGAARENEHLARAIEKVRSKIAQRLPGRRSPGQADRNIEITGKDEILCTIDLEAVGRIARERAVAVREQGAQIEVRVDVRVELSRLRPEETGPVPAQVRERVARLRE